MRARALAATTALARATDSDVAAARRRASARDDAVAADVAPASALDVASRVAPVRDVNVVAAITCPAPSAEAVARAAADDAATLVPTPFAVTGVTTPEHTTRTVSVTRVDATVVTRARPTTATLAATDAFEIQDREPARREASDARRTRPTTRCDESAARTRGAPTEVTPVVTLVPLSEHLAAAAGPAAPTVRPVNTSTPDSSAVTGRSIGRARFVLRSIACRRGSVV